MSGNDTMSMIDSVVLHVVQSCRLTCWLRNESVISIHCGVTCRSAQPFASYLQKQLEEACIKAS